MSDNPNPNNLNRRQFLIYSTAVTSAVTAGVILKTDAQANAPQALGPAIVNDGSHGIYGYA